MFRQEVLLSFLSLTLFTMFDENSPPRTRTPPRGRTSPPHPAERRSLHEEILFQTFTFIGGLSALSLEYGFADVTEAFLRISGSKVSFSLESRDDPAAVSLL